MNAARPLDAGQHRVGFTFGGPFTTQLGPPIPAPMLLVEARSGLKPVGAMPLDLNYGLNLTTLAFGDIGIHGGASLHIAQPEGWRPGLVLTERLHVYNNFLDVTKPAESRRLWGINEFDVTATWAINDQRVYFGFTDALDLRDPELLIGPFVGIDLLGKRSAPAFISRPACKRLTSVQRSRTSPGSASVRPRKRCTSGDTRRLMGAR